MGVDEYEDEDTDEVGGEGSDEDEDKVTWH